MHLVKAVPAVVNFDLSACSKEYDCGVIHDSVEKTTRVRTAKTQLCMETQLLNTQGQIDFGNSKLTYKGYSFCNTIPLC